ncbi:hypothetical protein Q3G72_015422 [Acer saccharum]|nr:hypothetical protein Q3G72_015422 [Acer saccharum]
MTKLVIIYFVQIVILALLFNIGQTTVEESSGNDVASVHVINGLPEKSKAMKIECSLKGKSVGIFHDLVVGDEYSWIVKEKGLYFCEAIWGSLVGSWHAFQPRRDANRTSVFWLVKHNGFFLSWDNSTWIKRSTWETE